MRDSNPHLSELKSDVSTNWTNGAFINLSYIYYINFPIKQHKLPSKLGKKNRTPRCVTFTYHNNKIFFSGIIFTS